MVSPLRVLSACFVIIPRDEALQSLLLSGHVLSTVPPVADFNRDPVRANACVVAFLSDPTHPEAA